MTNALPPLRKKIFRSYIAVFGVLGSVGAMLVVVTVFSAVSLTPQMIHQNYDSIGAARNMKTAWIALQVSGAYPNVNKDASIRTFEESLKFQRNNITEPGEREVTDHISRIWTAWKAGRCDSACLSSMFSDLDALMNINEVSMFSFVSASHRFKVKAAVGVAVFFLIALILTLYLVDSLSTRLSNPLKAIAEVLRSKPDTGEKLKLPQPNSLEIRILTEELQSLWNRVSRNTRINIEEILKQRSQLETLLSAVEDAVLVIDSQGVVTHVSEHMAALLRLNASEIIGGRWSDLPTIAENYLKLRELSLDKAQSASTVELHYENDGIRTYAARMREARSASGQVVSTIFLLHDITEVRNRDRLKAEFIGVLSHELRTPIQSLGTAAELLEAKKENFDSRSQMLIDTLIEDVTRVKTVSDQFIQIGQISEAALIVVPQTLCLNDMIIQWLKPFELLAEDKKVHLEFTHEGSEKIGADLDPLRFPWVISNLLSNSIRVSPEGGRVKVLVTDRNNYAEIVVSDEGPGIPEDIQRRMFEPYFQGAPRKPVEVAGVSGVLGLGLTIAREVTDAHGGIIEYHAVKPHGASFRVLLPLKTI